MTFKYSKVTFVSAHFNIHLPRVCVNFSVVNYVIARKKSYRMTVMAKNSAPRASRDTPRVHAARSTYTFVGG